MLNLLQEIQHDRHVALLFISHDMVVVRRISQRIAIMHAGELVEVGEVDRVFEQPEHGYTRRLISGVSLIKRG
jgi:ABC-type oligopeptide transport system ATPase subunit